MMACVDTEKRAASAANHSCTHLLDEALRQVLGTHVEQKGSLVTPESLRFDFSHFQKVTDEQLREVEHLVNTKIRENIPLTEYRNLPIEKAKELGAIALFGEKYGDEVRVVQFGNSIEFCGGTHVSATGKIGMVQFLRSDVLSISIRKTACESARNSAPYSAKISPARCPRSAPARWALRCTGRQKHQPRWAAC